MKPLQSVAMGCVFVALYARIQGYDAYADPFGWLLVLLGVRRLADETPLRGAMLGTAALALLVSLPLWVPAVRDPVGDLGASVGWALDLPAFACLAVLCHGLAEAADTADDPGAARWLRLLRTAVAVVALLPVLVFGAGVEDLVSTASLLSSAVYVALVWLLFGYSGRPWAVRAAVERPTASPAA
ncbi:hypothetical protein LRP67_03585 [Nocardioides sp. cx-169]|uniref:hypothetical protein n=1 Tax=Nocardioides sp. cx-169 TaxID=2899080 RepID=UPI001E53C159|nr:hypothetical protein [Nocardioides sp. cx-169]MCD4533160.1 hypothetical protein [Nocardioides sp. cx-169]